MRRKVPKGAHSLPKLLQISQSHEGKIQEKNTDTKMKNLEKIESKFKHIKTPKHHKFFNMMSNNNYQSYESNRSDISQKFSYMKGLYEKSISSPKIKEKK